MISTTAEQLKTFLIVDDEPLIRMELGDIVQDCGFNVLEAANTAEALALLDANDGIFTGIITDIAMPGTRSGVVLAHHVRYMWPHIPIIIVSAARLPRSWELPDHVEFIAKPVAPQRLAAKIKAFTTN
jgi:CheY-like chemotaxis protein